MIDSTLDNEFEKILNVYKEGEAYQRLLSAKEFYFDLTGMLNDDDDDYEARMNCFNDWFVFHHELPSGERVIEKYFNNEDITKEMRESLLGINFSLFEFVKVNFKKEIVLKDILHDQKLILPKEHPNIGLVENDLFISRTINHQEDEYLLKGVRTFPNTLKSVLKKQCKKVRKLKNKKEETIFLLQLEELLTKSKRYSHLEPSKIFVF
jgi:hypothetical protein